VSSNFETVTTAEISNRPTILVIDDEPDSFEVISEILYESGYHIQYTSDGMSALKRLERSQPDVILLDVMMPEMDGLEVCRQIKAKPSWNHIPIIMVTALYAKEDLVCCLDAGADDFISKPISALETRARIRSMLRIKQQHDRILASLKLRKDMANMIVHDLRNPLSSILLSCEMLDREDLPEKTQTKVSRIRFSQQQLQSLTESLLLTAKLESGKMILNLEQLALSQIVETSIRDLQAIANQKSIQLVSELRDAQVSVWADSLLLRRVLDNLVSNAIKYSPSKSRVTIKSSLIDSQTMQIQVLDMGTGISNDLKQKVFEKYEIGPSLASVNQVGLGLAFCQMAIKAHQGKIFVTDNDPQGTIISITLNTILPNEIAGK